MGLLNCTLFICISTEGQCGVFGGDDLDGEVVKVQYLSRRRSPSNAPIRGPYARNRDYVFLVSDLKRFDVVISRPVYAGKCDSIVFRLITLALSIEPNLPSY